MASPTKRAFLVRLPPEVLAAMERVATSELRSVNAQVEVMLREPETARCVTKIGPKSVHCRPARIGV